MNPQYTSSVKTQAGWRSVSIVAQAEQISTGMARVTRVVSIDGEAPASTLSRTGARRQQYWASGVAEREVGAKKRISACSVLA